MGSLKVGARHYNAIQVFAASGAKSDKACTILNQWKPHKTFRDRQLTHALDSEQMEVILLLPLPSINLPSLPPFLLSISFPTIYTTQHAPTRNHSKPLFDKTQPPPSPTTGNWKNGTRNARFLRPRRLDVLPLLQGYSDLGRILSILRASEM